MGRVSKRKAGSRPTEILHQEEKRYKAGIYARLSSDQDVKKNESVEVQIEIAKKFVEEFNRKETGEVIESGLLARNGFPSEKKVDSVVYVNRTNHDLRDMRRVPKKSYHWLKRVIESDGEEM